VLGTRGPELEGQTMMLLARRGSLAVVLLILASVGTASAGARVLRLQESRRYFSGSIENLPSEIHPSLLHSARREKVLCILRVQVPPGELSVDPSSYRDGKKGDRLAEALGTSAHLGWVCESTGRNASEARAGLEREVVSADLPE
jgi:hypothetical protein